MPRLAGGNTTVPAAHFVLESDETVSGVGNRGCNGDLVIETRRADISALRFRDGQKNVITDFHVLIIEANRLTIFYARNFHPYQVVGVIDNAHLVSFGITDANGTQVWRHYLNCRWHVSRLVSFD